MDTISQKKSMPVRSTRVTATVSVAIVLFLLGLAAVGGSVAHNVIADIRQHIGFVVVMDEAATPEETAAMKARFDKAEYVSSYRYSTAAEVKKRWEDTLNDDEDINELLGDVNPFAPEFEVFVKSDYASGKELSRLTVPIESAPGVDIVTARTSMAEKVNHTVRRLTMVLAGIAVVLLLIAIVLINNTVRLTIYSRRFLIHTMKLVGASGGFIRRPILVSNVVMGIIAAFVATVLLSGLYGYGMQSFPELDTFLTWTETAIVVACMLVGGILICLFTAIAATNKYLRKSYDEMF